MKKKSNCHINTFNFYHKIKIITNYTVFDLKNTKEKLNSFEIFQKRENLNIV